jgi:hypothetical protein
MGTRPDFVLRDVQSCDYDPATGARANAAFSTNYRIVEEQAKTTPSFTFYGYT